MFGIFLGLGLSAAPLVLGGILLSFLCLTFNSLCLWFIDERTPMSKRCFIPTVTNLKSVLWNRQFVVYICGMCFIYFINTVPALYLFFLTYVLDESKENATVLYLLSVGGFVLTGFVAMPMAPRLIAKYGKSAVVDCNLKAMIGLGVLLFVATYVHPAMVVVVFSIVGFGAALGGEY